MTDDDEYIYLIVEENEEAGGGSRSQCSLTGLAHLHFTKEAVGSWRKLWEAVEAVESFPSSNTFRTFTG
jgi:hypothetical protein